MKFNLGLIYVQSFCENLGSQEIKLLNKLCVTRNSLYCKSNVFFSSSSFFLLFKKAALAIGPLTEPETITEKLSVYECIRLFDNTYRFEKARFYCIFKVLFSIFLCFDLLVICRSTNHPCPCLMSSIWVWFFRISK